MIIDSRPDLFFIFDLDDTLYPEMDYLASAYKEIAAFLEKFLGRNILQEMLEMYHAKKNVFEWLVSEYSNFIPTLSLPLLLRMYREHEPDLRLANDVRNFLDSLAANGIPAGLITDGRSVSQRNKLKALGLADYFKDIIISEEFGSEKPDPRNYEYFVSKYPNASFCFVGDNLKKDFIVPHRLQWLTICIKDAGKNIHRQDFDNCVMPRYIISSFDEIEVAT